MKKLLLGLLAIGLQAQVFSVVKTTVLSGTAEVITIQQPAAGTSKNIVFLGAYVDCTVACTITLERNGTAATTTQVTPAQVNPQLGVIATAQGFSASNVGTGTVIGKYSNSPIIIDLSSNQMSGTGSTQNLTIRSSAISGTINIVIVWREL